RLGPLTGRARATGSQLRTEGGEERQGPVPRLDACFSVAPEREDADRKIGGSRVAEGTQPIDDGRLVPLREDVAHVGGVASREQALVVRAELGLPEHLVCPCPCLVHLVVGADDDRSPGHTPRSRPAVLGSVLRVAIANALGRSPVTG